LFVSAIGHRSYRAAAPVRVPLAIDRARAIRFAMFQDPHIR
jgi:hypothetical protein